MFVTYKIDEPLFLIEGDAVAQSVERATSGQEVPGFDSRCGRPLPTGWVGVSIMWSAKTEVMVHPLCLLCGST